MLPKLQYFALFLQNLILLYNVLMKKIIFTILILLGFCGGAFAVNPNQLKDDGMMLYSVNKINEAKEMFEQIPEERRDAEVWLLLSNIAQDLQDEQNVEKYLRLSLEKNPKFYKAYYNLGNIYFNKGNIDEALKNYKLAAKYNNKNGYIYTNIGCCYLAKQNLHLARINFNKAVSLNSQNPTNYYNLAYICKQKGNTKKAEELLKIYNTLMQDRAN